MADKHKTRFAVQSADEIVFHSTSKKKSITKSIEKLDALIKQLKTK